MKNLIIFTFLMAFCSVGNSQSNLDSLWNVWEDKTNEDTVRLNALFTYNELGFVKKDPDSSLFFCSLGIQKSKKENSKYFLPKFIKQRGDAYNNKGLILKKQEIMTKRCRYLKKV